MYNHIVYSNVWNLLSSNTEDTERRGDCCIIISYISYTFFFLCPFFPLYSVVRPNLVPQTDPPPPYYSSNGEKIQTGTYDAAGNNIYGSYAAYQPHHEGLHPNRAFIDQCSTNSNQGGSVNSQVGSFLCLSRVLLANFSGSCKRMLSFSLTLKQDLKKKKVYDI